MQNGCVCEADEARSLEFHVWLILILRVLRVSCAGSAPVEAAHGTRRDTRSVHVGGRLTF